MKREDNVAMDNRDAKRYVEAIKFAAGCLQYRSISVRQTLGDSISLLYSYYEKLNNKEYLEIAILHIQAYLEMGFEYEKYEKTFNKVLESLGTSRCIKFPKKFYMSNKIRLNKSQVKSMIKKWPASPYQVMKIDDVVEDIIKKVQDHQNGIFYYKCAVTGDLYELVVSNKELFFHDVVRGKFYTFED